MNKDLDERIIPNGQYRDAMNIKVTSSDDASVGTVQNLLGNYRVEDIVPTEYVCIATVADEKTNCLYWFVTNRTTLRHAILQYNISEESHTVVLLDEHNNTLKFGEKIITGINVINNLLFWTDNNSEPKKINIQDCIQGTTQLQSLDTMSHTKLVVDGVVLSNDIEEEHITVIKKNPKIAPSFTINKPTDSNASRLFEQVFPRFSLRYKYKDGEYSSFGPFTDVVFNPIYTEEFSVDDFYSVKESYNTAMVNSIESIEIKNFISSDVPKDVTQVEILYKEDGSSVVFSIKTIDYDDAEWTDNVYTLKSETIFAAIPSNQFLRPFDNVPTKALAQEITGNRLVYGNYTQNYDLLAIGGAKVKPKIEATYNLRPLNNDFTKGGLPSLKAQREYQLGLVFGDKYGRETPVFTSESGGVNIPYKDNERDIGLSASNSLSFSFNLNTLIPTWADYYKVYVKETSGDYYNLIMTKAYAQTSLNVFDEEEDRVWLAFPSADRNKVTEDDYLILKRKEKRKQVALKNKFKILDISNEAPDAVRFEYVTLGEAKQDQLDGGSTRYLEDNSNNEALFNDADNRIDKVIDSEGVDTIHIRRDSWINVTGGGSLTNDANNANMYVDDIYLMWKSPGQNSEKYKVVSIFVLNNVYQVRLNRKITQFDAESAINNDPTNYPDFALKHDLVFSCERKIEKDLDEFSGKFFVQIVVSSSIKKEQTTEELLQDFVVGAVKPTHWFMDDDAGSADPDLGIINAQANTVSLDPTSRSYTLTSIVSGATVGYSGVDADWVALAQQLDPNKERGFFIDNMAFAAGQSDVNNFAKNAGETWKGWGSYYPKHPVWTQLTDDQFTFIEGAYGWTMSGSIGGNPNNNGYQVLDPAYYNPRPFGGVSYPVEETKNINGLEGFITTDVSHIRTGTLMPDGTTNYFNSDVGYRAWKNGDLKSSSYTANPYDGVVKDGQTGKYFLHLSFLGPGKDLVSDDAFNGAGAEFASAKTFGRNSVGNFMQGIWGGGVFGDPTANGGSGVIVEMEGNYDDNDEALEQTPRVGINAQGYNIAEPHATNFDNQWDPLHGDDSTELAAFVNNIVEGKQFRFASNGDFLNNAEEVFTIKSVTTKKLYNHTPWKAQYKWDGSNSGSASVGSGLVTCNNSVDEAAIAWASTIDNGNPNGLQAEFTAFQDTVIRFGKKHNRRLVYIIELDKDPTDVAITGAGTAPDVNSAVNIEFITTNPNSLLKDIIQKPAIWETEAKPGENLDLYYEASQAYSFKLNDKTNQNFAPIGCKVEILLDEAKNGQHIITEDIILESWDDNQMTVSDPGFNVQKIDSTGTLVNIDYTSVQVRFFRKDGSYTTTRLTGLPVPQGIDYVKIFDLDPTLDASMEHGLSYYNCYSFGDGVESNRIRGDFNSPSISKGVKASLVLDQEYKEENRKNGLIFSGIYNSTSGVNSLNQFIMAENITKDLNPTYGSIQKLFQRRVSLVAFCEDRVVSVTSNKDQLFNADGNPQLIASNAVLGDATPFVGDFGISKNPESFAKESYRAYFADKQRGAVLRLSMDGITPISEAGMSDYFRDNLKVSGEIVGSYDAHSKNYNLTLKGRKPGENIINNSSFDAFVSSTTGFTPTELVVDGSLNQIDALVLPDFDIANQLMQNRYIHTNCTIENFSYLPAGFWAETTTTTDVITSNSVFSNASYSQGQIFNQNFNGNSANWYNGVIGDPFGSGKSGNLGEHLQYRVKTTYPFTRFSFGQYPEPLDSQTGNGVGLSGDIFWYDGTFDANAPYYMDTAFFPLNQPTEDGDGQVTTSSQGQGVNTEGIAFDVTSEGVILPGEHLPAPPPNPPGTGTLQVNNTKVPNGVLQHLNTINGQNLQPYTGVRDNTILNGEQVRLIFKFKNNAYQYPNLVGNTPAPRRVKISLWDGYDPSTRIAVPDNYIFDPSTSTITQALPYGDYSNNPSPNSSTFAIGYATTATVEFPEMSSTNVSSNDYEVQHEVYFKFNDDTEQEKILVQDLQVQIELLDDINTLSWGILMSFQMRKNYRLTSPETIVTTQVGNGDALPPYDVQAFAEVEYGATSDWSVDFYDATYPGGTLTTPNLAYFGPSMLNVYGAEYISNVVSGTQNDGTVHTWNESPNGPGGGSNGVTGFNDHVDGLKNVNDKFEFAGVDQFGNPSEAVLKQSYTTTTGNWYMLDLDIDGEPFSGALPRLLDFEVDFFQTTELQNYSGQITDIYRCVFQGDDTFDTLKILFYSSTIVTIRKVAMLDITTTWSGGTHTNGDWNFNYGTNNNPYPINSLSQPTIWASANGIEFNTSIGGGTYASVFQNLPTGLESTLDGYEFKFNVRNYGGYPYGGSLSFYCIGDTEGMEGQHLVLSDGDYVIQGNLDGGAYDVNYTNINGQTFSSGTTTQASINTTQTNIINFFSNGFIGSITDISFRDLTNYFVGGSAGSFTFTGFDTSVQTYIDFQDDGSGSGLLAFDNSPILGATGDQIQIQQQISKTIHDSDFYRFKFKHVITSGAISGYYFNYNGKGFRFSGITGNDTYNVLHEMSTDIAADGSELQETLVIFVEQDATTGTIDNILFSREFPSIQEQTVSFSESVRGWTSFKSFMPEQGISLSSQYFTVKSGGLWEHDAENVNRNTFYNIPTDSSITAVLNESPSSVKIFNTLNYEGSQSSVVQGQITNRYGNDYNTLDTYNLNGELGWSVDYLKTDKQEGTLSEFIEKEGKWFNYIRGLGDINSIKTSDLSFQGLGVVALIN